MRADPKRYRELEDAIDGVVASYTGELEIDNLESAALPSKRAVIEALDHLKPVLFMGFYATRGLHRDSLRHAIATHLHAAHQLLVEQIERALTYDHWMGRTDRVLPAGSGEAVVLGLFRDLPALRRTLNGDVRAAYDGDPAAKNIEEIVFSYPSIEAVTAYRIAHRLSGAGVPMLPRILTEHAHARTGIDISPGARIGERFFIDHGTGVVIGETAVIGDDVKLYQNVTLGALSVPNREDAPGKKRHPTIEDEVTIYSGATILGGDTVIGRGSVIGGNVWLTKSVPPGSKVFGRGKSEPEET
ncbi:serine O-acetyltransferase EpsC [Sandaracinus amylolyticus]|uniref:Serine acetyltransferase n=1 Tax=Sandaracinus amylolyticus TaxID=927083 RepID=A0A0F6SEX0_9BACT|nr:serine O-acetyltransferase EpsC [Sandaracinus amylolyticus]AKF05929.1 Serine acetyltransferase [Sandaracinus amylolyticus]